MSAPWEAGVAWGVDSWPKADSFLLIIKRQDFLKMEWVSYMQKQHSQLWQSSWKKESWAPKNWCFWTVVLEKTLESPLDCKEIQPVHPKGDKSWVFIGRTDAEAETPILSPPDELTHWKRLWCWEGLGAGGEGDDRGWDGWMASLTWWAWVWVNSRSWWWTGRPGVLQFMGSQRVGRDWVTELNWIFSSRLGLFPLLEARSWNYGSLCHGYILVFVYLLLHLMEVSLSVSQLMGNGPEYSLHPLRRN